MKKIIYTVAREFYERLVKICDITVKEMFYNFLLNGKEKYFKKDSNV